MDINKTISTPVNTAGSENYDYEDDGLDYTIYNFPKNKWIIIPNWQVILKIGTFAPVIIFGLIGNLILLNIICRNRALRTPTNLLISNMATADMATLIICPTLFMFHDFFQNYQLGAFGCKMEGFLEGLLLITAVLNLCAISYDRLTAIVLPLEAKLTINGAKILMLCTWVTGTILSIPLAIYRTYKIRIWKDFYESYCMENPTVLRMYWHVLIVALVWFPLGVMIICYSTIFHKLDRYEKKNLKREHPISVSYKTKVAKTVFIVVVTFVLLRMPFNVLVFIRDQMLLNVDVNQINDSFRILWYTAHYLIFLNAAINPVIYGLNNDNFRRAYHQTPLIPFFYQSKLIKNKNFKWKHYFGQFLNDTKQSNKQNINNDCRFNDVDCNKNLHFYMDSKQNHQQFNGISSKLTKTTNLRQITANKIEKKFDNTENSITKLQYKNENYNGSEEGIQIVNLDNYM